MRDNQIVDASLSAINASIEKVDIPQWCFSLPEKSHLILDAESDVFTPTGALSSM